MPRDSLVSLCMFFNHFTPTDKIIHPNTMDGRVHSALKGFNGNDISHAIGHVVFLITVFLKFII